MYRVALLAFDDSLALVDVMLIILLLNNGLTGLIRTFDPYLLALLVYDLSSSTAVQSLLLCTRCCRNVH